MLRSPDEVLAEELKKLAIRATRKEVGAGLVQWVAGKMPQDAYELEVDFNANAEDVLRSAFSVLEQMGQIRDDIVHQSGNPVATAVVGSGWLGLNPAVVAVEVTAADHRSCRVTIYAAAKEGLIKQRAGEKAARKTAQLLTERLDGDRR